MRLARVPGTFALIAALGGCQQPEPVYDVPTSRVYTASSDAVWDDLSRFLQANRIKPVSGSPQMGVLDVERQAFNNDDWADCQPAWVTDRTSNSPRPVRARPLARDLSMRIVVRQVAGGTEVMLDPRFSERQINPYRNLPFEVPCRSKGALERALLDAVDNEPAKS